MDRLVKCPRGEDCFVCRDFTEEEIEALRKQQEEVVLQEIELDGHR